MVIIEEELGADESGKEERIVSVFVGLDDMKEEMCWFAQMFLSIKASDIITVIIAVVAGGFAFRQWVVTNRIKRAELIDSLVSTTRNDKRITHPYYTIEYGRKWYDKSFHNSKAESKFDYFFSHFDYICYLKKRGVIKKKDFKIFEYRLNRILTNDDVQNYFYNLYHFSKKQKLQFSFEYLRRYMKKKRFVDKEFMDPDSSRFNKYLSF